MNELISLYVICVFFVMGAMYSKAPTGIDAVFWLIMLILAPLSIFAYLGSRLERISRK